MTKWLNSKFLIACTTWRWLKVCWARLSQLELAQPSSKIEPAWAGKILSSVIEPDWAEAVFLWASLSYIHNHEFLGNKSDFLIKNVIFWPKMSFFSLFLGIQPEPGWASSTWLKLTQPSSIVEPAWAELNLQLNALSQLELSLICIFIIDPVWAEF